MASERIFQAHYSTDRARMFFHSSSYTANPIACAAACANLEIWREEPVLERVADLGQRLRQRLRELERRCQLRNSRAIGTIAVFEIGGGEGYLASEAPKLMKFFLERDVLLRPLGGTVYVMPPYCISDDDLDTTFAAIAEAIAGLQAGES